MNNKELVERLVENAEVGRYCGSDYLLAAERITELDTQYNSLLDLLREPIVEEKIEWILKKKIKEAKDSSGLFISYIRDKFGL